MENKKCNLTVCISVTVRLSKLNRKTFYLIWYLKFTINKLFIISNILTEIIWQQLPFFPNKPSIL